MTTFANTPPAVKISASDLSPRDRLLAATECILLNDGFFALSTRSISKQAQTNVSQIRYYFGGLEGLLEALLVAELDAVAQAFRPSDLATSQLELEHLVAALMDAVNAPAPFNNDGYAALVIEELYHHVSEGMRRKAAAALTKAHGPFIAALAKQVKGVDKKVLRIRFAAVIAIMMGLLPRGSARRLLTMSTDSRGYSEPALRDEIQRSCMRVFMGG